MNSDKLVEIWYVGRLFHFGHFHLLVFHFLVIFVFWSFSFFGHFRFFGHFHFLVIFVFFFGHFRFLVIFVFWSFSFFGHFHFLAIFWPFSFFGHCLFFFWLGETFKFSICNFNNFCSRKRIKKQKKKNTKKCTVKNKKENAKKKFKTKQNMSFLVWWLASPSWGVVVVPSLLGVALLSSVVVIGSSSLSFSGGWPLEWGLAPGPAFLECGH